MSLIRSFIFWLIIISIVVLFITQPIERRVTEVVKEGKVISTQVSYEWHPEKILTLIRDLTDKIME